MTYLGLKTCPNCNGTGEILVEVSGRDWNDPDGIFEEEPCPDCEGSGEIEDWEDDDED